MALLAAPEGGKTRGCEHGVVQSGGQVDWSFESAGVSATVAEKEGMRKASDSATGEPMHLAPESLFRSVFLAVSCGSGGE